MNPDNFENFLRLTLSRISHRTREEYGGGVPRTLKTLLCDLNECQRDYSAVVERVDKIFPEIEETKRPFWEAVRAQAEEEGKAIGRLIRQVGAIQERVKILPGKFPRPPVEDEKKEE
jgi:hypothetical protein